MLVLLGNWGLDRVHFSSTWQRVVHLQDRVVSLVQNPELPASTVALPARTATASWNAKPSPSWTRLPTRSLTPAATQAISLTVTPAVTVTVTGTPQPGDPSPTAVPDAPKSYTVRSGDTLMDIGNATGISWEAIAAANDLSSNSSLHVGQELRLPTSTPAPDGKAPSPTPAKPQTYRVQAGDTLLVIGERLGVPWQDIASANNITDGDVLHIDQELTIPAASK